MSPSAAGLAHDLANVLGAIDAAAEEALARDGADAAALGEIRRHVARGAALVAAFGGDTSNATPAGPVVFAEAIADLAPLLRRLAGATVALDLAAGTDLTVRIDALSLERMLANLVANARDAMPEGGRIAVRARREGALAVVEVSDTGPGIAPELLDRLFEPSVSSKGAGRGQGLATVRALVQLAGGAVAVRNTQGGACFVVTLPLAGAPPGSILLVDDEDTIRCRAARRFAQAGWRVREASSAGAARASLAEETPALLVCDLSLPDEDGMALLREAIGSHPALHAIVISGYADAGLRETCASLGARFLAKPFSLGALLDLAEDCMRADVVGAGENI